ncbi:MAG: cyclase family protein [Actinobacteria bacterium]|nr:cyclase family protein [Actinomycetota bacterium]
MLPSRDPIDLTQPLRSDMPVFLGDPAVRISPHSTHQADGFAVASLHLGTHSGTHLDTPFHFLAAGRTLESYPLSRVLGPGVVLDLRSAGRELDAETVAEAIEDAGGLRQGDFAVLWTGWDAHFGDELMREHPYLTPKAARLLVGARVGLLGTDAPNVDASTGDDFPVHPIVLGADVLIVENLCGLERLGAGRAWFAFVPLRLVGVDGAPIRALAWKD